MLLLGIGSLALAVLSWPIFAVLFFGVFQRTRLIQSMVIGAAVAAVALALGLVPLIASVRRKGGERIFSSLGIASAFGSIVMLLFYSYMAQKVSDQLPAGSPVAQAAKEILGTAPPTIMRLKCAACGHEFEMASTEFLRLQTAQGLELMKPPANVDKLLDDVEKAGGAGIQCPKCKKRAAQPMIKCVACNKYFQIGKDWQPGLPIKCPLCGHEKAADPTDIFNLVQPASAGEEAEKH